MRFFRRSTGLLSPAPGRLRPNPSIPIGVRRFLRSTGRMRSSISRRMLLTGWTFVSKTAWLRRWGRRCAPTALIRRWPVRNPAPGMRIAVCRSIRPFRRSAGSFRRAPWVRNRHPTSTPSIGDLSFRAAIKPSPRPRRGLRSDPLQRFLRIGLPRSRLASLLSSLIGFPQGLSLLEFQASLLAPFAVGVHHVVAPSPYPPYSGGSSTFALVFSHAVAGFARDFAGPVACGAPDSPAVSARRAVLRLSRFPLGILPVYRAVRAAVFGVGGAPLDFAPHRVGFLGDFPGGRPFGLRGLEGRLVFLCRPCFWPFWLALG